MFGESLSFPEGLPLVRMLEALGQQSGAESPKYLEGGREDPSE